MRKRGPYDATILSTLFAFVLLLVIYSVTARVDLIFYKDGTEIARQENVCALTGRLNNPADSLPEDMLEEGEKIKFYFVDGGEKIVFQESSAKARIRIAKTTLKNLVTFRWSENSQVVEIHSVTSK